MATLSESEVLTYEDVLQKVVSNDEQGVEEKSNLKVGLRTRNNRSKPNAKQIKGKAVSSDEDSDSNTDTKKSNGPIRGQPKSGRFWKSEKTRFRTMVKTPGLATESLEKKLALRAELKRVKELSRAIITQRKDDKEAKKQRRRDNMKQAAENKKKSEIVQVIKNSAKMKKMKKKQLRFIEKRDTTDMK